MSKPITFAEQHFIEEFDAIATQFMKDVLGLDYAACFISDESRLSDFVGCGLPSTLELGCDSREALYDAWDGWVLREIKQRYALQLTNTKVSLVVLFNQIAQANARSTH